MYIPFVAILNGKHGFLILLSWARHVFPGTPMCMEPYIHIYIYTSIQLYIYTYVQLYIYTYVHIYIYIHIYNIYVYIYIHIYIYVSIHSCIYAYCIFQLHVGFTACQKPGLLTIGRWRWMSLTGCCLNGIILRHHFRQTLSQHFNGCQMNNTNHTITNYFASHKLTHLHTFLLRTQSI